MGRFGRHKSRDLNPSYNGSPSTTSYASSEAGSYLPPPSDSNAVASSSAGGSVSTAAGGGMANNNDALQSSTHSAFVRDTSFVTQPPKPAKGLTGKISTLFRREASRERSHVENIDGVAALSAEISVSASSQQSPMSPAAPPSQSWHVSPQHQRQKDLEDLMESEQQQRMTEHHDQIKKQSPNIPKASLQQVTSRQHMTDVDDDQSVGAISVSSRAGSTTKRIFYSSNQDDDSDDSYESRVSRASRASRGSRGPKRASSVDNASRGVSTDCTGFTTENENSRYAEDESDIYSAGMSELQTVANGGIRRYRGFSTSIKSLFLDEPLVCAAMGCFGLVLSNRTEYLLQLRNERRGALSSGRDKVSDADARKKSPSRIVGIGLTLTLVLMFSTFIIWGFGSGGADTKDSYLNDYMNGYDNFDDQQKSQWWDDYLLNDDDRFGSRNYKKNQNQYDDAKGDDKYAANKNYGDDGNNNDDNNNVNAGDDNAGDDKAGDDNVNDDANGDDYYKADDGGRRDRELNTTLAVDAALRHRKFDRSWAGTRQHVILHDSLSTVRYAHHPIHGIFKIRDYEENVWHPIGEFLINEWYRGDSFPPTDAAKRVRRRTEGEGGNDDGGQTTSETDSPQSNADSSSNSQAKRDIASDIRIALLFTFLLFLGILGRRRRMRTRFYLVRARAQDDHLYYASSDEAASRRVAFDDTREDQYEGACSHTLCGCYPSDEVEAHPNDEEVKVSDSGIFKRVKRTHHEDIVARGFSCFMYACCGALFKCWFQCLSICALAQEAREIRLLVPPRHQRIDYITHQPFHEYQEAVNDLRRGWLGHSRRMAGILPHYHALSRFSRWIIVLSLLGISIIVATLYFNPRAAFSWQDAVVLIATFLQSFLVLFVVHGIFHKSDLSLDAVIKMFTAGFLIAVPSAFFFEGLVLNVVIFFAWIAYYVATAIFGDSFGEWIFDHWRAVWFIGEILNAFIIAALIEELCKYYTFRAVEHPDLIFLTGLHLEKQGDKAVEGGVTKYPFASHQVQELSREASMDDASSVSSYRSSSSKRHRHSRSGRKAENLIDKAGISDEFKEDENDVRTHRQKAMAITTGMISAAVGLACAENFLYVFVLGGALQAAGDESEQERQDDIIEAWIVLFFRSIFPIHALAAAMQSVNVIRKFVETDHQHGHRIGVGRIILPAVIIHGSFDAVLMCINVFIETSTDRYLDEHEGKIAEGEEVYNTFMLNLVAWASIVLILVAGLLWYFNENRKQRARLIVLEECEKNSRLDGAVVGTKTTSSPGSTPRGRKKSSKGKSKRRDREIS